MGYDFNESRQEAAARTEAAAVVTVVPVGPADAGEAAAAAMAPDWTGLVARFRAIHALRRTLGVPAPTPVTGSFPAAGTAVLSACRNDDAVNLVYLANSKEACAITGSVAVLPPRGDRGLI